MDSPYQFDPHQLHLRKGKYYASVAIPREIRHLFSEPRLRKSTGLSDRKEANRRAVQVQVPAIHRELNAAFSRLDPFIEGLRYFLEKEGIDVGTWYTSGEIKVTVFGDRTQTTKLGLRAFSSDGRPIMPIENWVARDYVSLAGMVSGLGYSISEKLLSILPDEQREAIYAANEPKSLSSRAAIKLAKDYPQLFENDDSLGSTLVEHLETPARKISIESKTITTPLFSQLVGPYLEEKLRASADKKTHGKRRLACQRIIEQIGDLPITAYDRVHAIELARLMDAEGCSNALIKDTISYGRGLFKYAGTKRNEEKTIILPNQPWTDIALKGYGTQTRSYLPLSHDELALLFKQQMGQAERLLLSILITTGMRLDEVALMTWERITTFEEVLCFSLLSDIEQVKVKNQSSARYIPVPKVIQPLLSNRGEGRVFSYRLDTNGKAENAASKAAMPIIRAVTKDDRKAIHSLRGNFKDFVRDIGVSKEINDFLTGHGQGDVAGRRYGKGPSMRVRSEVIDTIKHLWLQNLP